MLGDFVGGEGFAKRGNFRNMSEGVSEGLSAGEIVLAEMSRIKCPGVCRENYTRDLSRGAMSGEDIQKGLSRGDCPGSHNTQTHRQTSSF